MNFIVGGDFSHELSHRRYREAVDIIERELDTFFELKEYGERIMKIYCGVICGSKEFEQFLSVRPAKLLRKEPALEFEFKLDFQTYKAMNDEERLKYIASEYFKNLKDIFANKPIKGFDSELFIQDLEAFLTAEKLLI
ncbi:MAG: hypothetical protein EAZ46_09090 [Runella sp.]|nr:MAG: hypothetical protein EAZ46_09090 [Runella sp.]